MLCRLCRDLPSRARPSIPPTRREHTANTTATRLSREDALVQQAQHRRVHAAVGDHFRRQILLHHLLLAAVIACSHASALVEGRARSIDSLRVHCYIHGALCLPCLRHELRL